jgi:hypothetical protein
MAGSQMLPVRVTSAGIVSPARARAMRSRLSRIRASSGAVGVRKLRAVVRKAVALAAASAGRAAPMMR